MNPSNIEKNDSEVQRQWSALHASDLRRYGLAVLSVAIAIGLVLVLRYLHFRDVGGPALLFAVGIASWYGGTGPAVLASVLAILCDDYFCTKPYYSFIVSSSDFPYFILFSGFTVILSWFAAISRRREVALQQTEEYLVEAQRLSHTGSWAWPAAANNSDYWSEEMFRIFGFDPHEPIPRIDVFMQSIHPEDRERTRSKFEKVFREKVDVEDEYRYVMADGTVKHILATARPFLNEAGALIKVVGSIMDITDLRRAEESLALWGFALDKARDAVFIVNERGRCVYVNEQSSLSLGYTREELLGMSVQDLDPDFPAERWPDHWRDLRAQRFLKFESRHRTKDGRIVPVEITATYLEQGTRAFVLAIVRDITDRKKAEETLRRSEAYLAEAQRLTQTGSWAWDVPSGSPEYWSEEMFRIFGFDPHEPIPRIEVFMQRIHPEDRARTRSKFENVFKEKADQVDDFRFIMADGTVKHIHSTAHPLPNEAGETIKVVGSMMDITERKRVEESLALWGFALDNARDAAFFIDEQAHFLHVNEQACRSLGYSREEILGMGVSDIDPDFPKERWPDQWRKVQAQRYVNLESRHRTKDGRSFPVEITVSYLEYEGRAFNFAIARDITERKKTEQRIQAFQDELQQLTRYLNKAREEERTAIARDLHDELGQQLSILTIDLAGLEGRLPEPHNGLAAALKEINQRVDDAIRTVQRLATGLRPALLDDLGLVAAIQWQAKDFSKRTGIPSDVSAPKEAVKLDRDLSTALFRIFQESLTNVARHAQASRVKVCFAQGKEGIALEIADNGRGIRKAEASASTSLGLIGMRERLRPWNGQVEVTGRDGQGTTVHVKVPPVPAVS